MANAGSGTAIYRLECTTAGDEEDGLWRMWQVNPAGSISETLSGQLGKIKRGNTYKIGIYNSFTTYNFYDATPGRSSTNSSASREEMSPTQLLSRSGRRVWNLEFSYMDDGDLWGSNQSLLTSTTFQDNLLTDLNFFSQVWHKTLGGTIPFIFQPNANDNNPSQFAICRLRNNSLKATQPAFNVYDISVVIEEVW